MMFDVNELFIGQYYLGNFLSIKCYFRSLL